MANEPNTFVVEGNGPFPWDMLRYDGAYPSRERDTATMLCSHERRTVGLCSGHPPTVKRWRSFGWLVISATGRMPEATRAAIEEDAAASCGWAP